MISFPNCKINLGLKVLRRREDGYHDLETVFYPLPLKDVLETIRSESLQFTATGLPIPGDPGTNLCCKAWYLLKKDFPALPPVHIYLHKHIPMGAGLGGGSSDGAAMLQLLNRQGQLQLGTERLLQYALELGSDCPFFILNQPCLGGGRGEVLQPVGLDLSGYSFVIVHPGIHIGTAWAFRRWSLWRGGPGLTRRARRTGRIGRGGSESQIRREGGKSRLPRSSGSPSGPGPRNWSTISKPRCCGSTRRCGRSRNNYTAKAPSMLP